MSQCPVCIEKLTNKNTVICHIPSCAYTSCKTCVKTYLLNTVLEPHCMNCRNKWNFDFVNTSLGNSFLKTTYSAHRANILADQVIAKKEEYIENALIYKQLSADRELCSKLNVELNQLRDAYQKKHAELETVRRRINHNDFQITRIFHNDRPEENKSKKSFVMPCQTNECRGMLNDKYYCILCEKHTCNKCLQSINENHKCNPDNIASAELIKSSSKPCPKCGMRISKIDGCDQMWCVECKTAFSWNKGTIEEGVVHNPHYYQWMRKNGSDIPRAEQNNGCETIENVLQQLNRFSHLFDANQTLAQLYPDNHKVKVINDFMASSAHVFNQLIHNINIIYQFDRFKNHIQADSLRLLRNNIDNKSHNLDNIYLYIIGKNTREELGVSLVSKENNEIKQRAFIDILTAIHTVLTEILQTIINNIQIATNNLEDIRKLFPLRDYIVYTNNYWDHERYHRVNDEIINLLYDQIKSEKICERFVLVINNILSAIKEPIINANKYLAYSNVEQIKLLKMHNSKKKIEIWNFEKCEFQDAHFHSKDNMTESIEKFSAMM